MYIKESKLNAMKKLKNQIGIDAIDALVEEKLFILRDSNGEAPYQILVDLSGTQIGYDSRFREILSYECFEEIPAPDTTKKEGLQNFYKLKQDHIEVYCKSLKTKE